MPSNTVIRDATPLNPGYSPENLQHRHSLQNQLQDFLTTTGRNLLLTGSTGTGKTAVLQDALRRSQRNHCFIPCTQFDTEYKALRQIHTELTDKDSGTGHHVSELQREIQKQVQHQKPVIVLDDIEHILFNDDDSLLYYLSRLEHSDQLNIILTSTKSWENLDIEERTRSSLQPHRTNVEPYTSEEAYQILAERARDSLKTRSLRREALTYIAATTQNITAGLSWLRTAAEQTRDVVTEDLIRTVRKQAYNRYGKYLLKDFSQHHQITLQAVQKALEEQDSTKVFSGEVYQQYQSLCETRKLDSLSERRISDHLKQLELLQLIQSEYYYGGNKGKTREISIRPF